jgi:hypothetical protein
MISDSHPFDDITDERREPMFPIRELMPTMKIVDEGLSAASCVFCHKVIAVGQGHLCAGRVAHINMVDQKLIEAGW